MNISELIDRAWAPVAEAIEAGSMPGAVLGMVSADGSQKIRYGGQAQIVPKPRPMREYTWFDLDALTQVIYTTPAILKLAEEGRIELDAPLTTVLPDLRHYNLDAWERKVTFRQCLGHQTPFPAVEPIYTYGRDADLLRTFVLQREWKAGPSVYSDINFILLGFVIERLARKKIREFELGEAFDWEGEPIETAATEDCYWRHRVLVGEVHDDNCAALQGTGHAGLFGPVTSVLDFAQGLLDGTGASPQAIDLMRTPLSARRTHGWMHPHDGWSGGDHCGSEVIGHTGFTGTGLWIDFEAGHAWTLLTNAIHPTRHADSGIFLLRRALGDAINGA